MAKIRPIMNPAVPSGGKTPKSHKTHKTPVGHGPIMNPAVPEGGKTTKSHKTHTKTPTRPIMNPAIPVKPTPIMNVFTGGTKGTKGSS
jgi:hypothetical protein